MKATWNNAIIAQSDDTVIIDGNHYFPAEAVEKQYLVPSNCTSHCPCKGDAGYYTLKVDGQTNADAAWYYDDPKPEMEQIRGRVAFWKGVEITSDN